MKKILSRPNVKKVEIEYEKGKHIKGRETIYE
jgi:hypothetical protein